MACEWVIRWNVVEGETVEKELLTGRHTIAGTTFFFFVRTLTTTEYNTHGFLDMMIAIKCITCQTELGWKYHTTPDVGQKYKEGKGILEKVNWYLVQMVVLLFCLPGFRLIWYCQSLLLLVG